MRFLFLYSPSWLFLYPGLALAALGGLLSVALFFGPVNIGFRYIDFHTFIVTGSLMNLGLSMISFAVITRVYAYQTKLLPVMPRFFRLFQYINLEKGLLAGFLVTLLGLILMAWSISLSDRFEQIGYGNSVRLVFGGSLVLTTGCQVVLTSFVLSILGMKIKSA